MDDFVMGLVPHLVYREVLALNMEQSMHDIKSCIFTYNHEDELLQQYPVTWKIYNIKLPRNLPIICYANENCKYSINDSIVKHELFYRRFCFFFPTYRISFPWPWHVLFDFILFKELKFIFVNKIVDKINH